MRATLHARYSTDLQNVASIADQFAACRSFAAKDAIKIVATFEDAVISGGSAANRPGLHSLMRGADLRGGANGLADRAPAPCVWLELIATPTFASS